MSYVKIMIHIVWGTKNREPILIKSIREQVIVHILENAGKKDIHIDSLNGHLDHMHGLILLNPDMSVAKAMQLIKGESAYWMNKTKLIKKKFEWANEYYAESIGKQGIRYVRNYIKNQEAHHQRQTFREEYESFTRE